MLLAEIVRVKGFQNQLVSAPPKADVGQAEKFACANDVSCIFL
jgi:hypothetical protein